jgi:hypothetical protein
VCKKLPLKQQHEVMETTKSILKNCNNNDTSLIEKQTLPAI